MACCGKRVNKNSPVDRLGNKKKKKSSLSKYAYLNPNQIALRDAQEKEAEEDK